MQENPPAGHTLAEHREYLHEIVRLQLFFLHGYCREHPEEAFRDVLESRVDIYRKTDANPGPTDPAECFFDREPWLSMRKECEALYRKHPANREAFELEAFEVFRESLDARCRRDWLDRSNLAGYQCGSLRHESALRENKVMFFHIANAVSPRSFLDDAEYLGGCFLRLLDIAAQQFGAERIATRSWLNSLPAWLAFFPAEYLNNRQPPNRDVRWYGSFWGQFINARGAFNSRYGQIMRRTGRFPYDPCYAECSIPAMRRHIVSVISTQGKHIK